MQQFPNSHVPSADVRRVGHKCSPHAQTKKSMWVAAAEVPLPFVKELGFDKIRIFTFFQRETIEYDASRKELTKKIRQGLEEV
mmetsp:Transcript_61828/g.71899  ORF Transcript_61828/g.71899 Transcript_61828/m.71899 type:complete len:83 (+) Transcript_61828:19-267(+)